MELESNLMNAYKTAYDMACKELKNRDMIDISLNSNAIYNAESNTLQVRYLNDGYVVNCHDGEIKFINKEEEVTTTVKVLIMHYLLNANVRPLTGKHISFKEIPGGGAIYYQTFFKRAITPMVKTFGNNFEGFYKAGEKLGGKKEGLGHASITIDIFPLVPVTYVLWEGDEEMSSSGTILFDESITNYLPGEDIVLAASFGVYEMMKHSRG